MAKVKPRPEEGQTQYEAVMADIEADVQKQRNRLRFALFLVGILSTAYVARQAILAPAGPRRDPDSVVCVRAGGFWSPETHDVQGRVIEAYCGRTPPAGGR